MEGRVMDALTLAQELEVLRAIEWGDGDDLDWCLACRSHKWDGHDPNCKLAAMIAAREDK
jgi:hypothetical protein